MELAHIHDGDLLFVKSVNEVRSGAIAVVRVGDEVTIKRVIYKPDLLILEAANPAVENRYFTQAFTPENPGGARWDSYYVSVHDILSRQDLPAEDGGYDCIALSDFAFVRVYCTEHYIFPAGHTGSTQSEYIYTQYAPYFDDAVTPMQQNVGIREDMRLQETTIIIGGVEIGAVTLSRGRE